MQTTKLQHSIHQDIYKQLPITWEHALINLLINYSHIKELKASNLIVYFNAQAKNIQIVTSAWGATPESTHSIWSDTKKEIWVHDALALGNRLNFETKLNHEAVASSFDLFELDAPSEIKKLDADKFMKLFNTGSRLTIENINFELAKGDIATFYKTAQLHLLPLLFNQNLKIIINWIDNDGIYSYDGTHFISIKELNKSTYVSVPEIPSIQREISFKVDDNDQTFEVNGFLTANYLDTGMFIYDGYQLISVVDHQWVHLIDKTLVDHFIYVQIDNLEANFLKTDFLWSPSNKQTFYKTLISTFNQVEKMDSKTELETTKLFLTKAFEIAGNSNQFADFEIIKNKLKFVYTADDGKQITINLIKNKKPDTNEWLQLIPLQESIVDQIYEYDVNFNVKHPYFAAFEQREMQLKIEQFVICYAIAETICRLDGSGVTKLKYEIDKILRGKL